MWNSCLDGMRILFPDVIQTIWVTLAEFYPETEILF